MNDPMLRPNHLIHEKSPYLLQHAYNPVAWYPWGDEAIEKARKEDKPILLSIGYSTCHWCHVMEKESFSNIAIADIMNRHFISIKLDREERPDLDQIYITAVSAITGSAGWPLNVFLTPELQPFYGGTYFPAQPRLGIVSWPDLLQKINEVWEQPEKRRRLVHSAAELTGMIEKTFSLKPGDTLPDESVLDKAYHEFFSSYDTDKGGFGPAPKFPMPGVIDFLLFYHEYKSRNGGNDSRRVSALNMAVFTLRAMSAGGIYDQIGGGFHRYATDVNWHVPHFEKMLYDNAQLIESGLDAYRITGDKDLLTISEETIGYVLRDMTHPDGGFFSAEDADSVPDPQTTVDDFEGHVEKQEGAYYAWRADEINDLIDSADTDMVSYHYGIRPGGNVAADPHGYFTGKNVLFVAHGPEETARHFGIPLPEIKRRLSAAQKSLFAARERRKRPDRDDKIIASWNGLMISALAKAYRVTAKLEYLSAARNAADFIMKALYDSNRCILYRTYRNGEKGPMGLAGDYSFMIRALLDLDEVDSNPDRRRSALRLNEELIRNFWDQDNGGGFFLTSLAHDPYLILRIKEFQDGVIPSSNSIAAGNLFRISKLTGDERYRKMAEEIIKTVMSQLGDHPSAAPRLLMAFNNFSM